MIKKQKVNLILRVLENHFPHPQIPLYHTDHYTLLIAVLLSCQCTDKRVNLVTPFLFEKANTPELMSQLPLETIENIIRPCGMSRQKAKAIKGLSEILIKDYSSKVPSTFEELESLPGVGHKTASVIMTSCFHLPAFPVDTHIFRCARRWGLSKGKNVKEVEKDLKKTFPEKKWASLHLQMIYYARAFCPARGHALSHCEICQSLAKDCPN